MQTESYNVIGVMSGTSLDGIDLANVILTLDNGTWGFKILAAETIAYTREWIHTLKSAVDYSESELNNLNIGYTQLLGAVINSFIERHKLQNLDAICSHGHTILHDPSAGMTLQIGNRPEIASIVNHTVVCDFRVQDVEMGGQGAPLVPIGDRFLFSDYDYCLNLGGFSNVSFENNGRRIAFDISPVNTVLNYYSNKLGFDYDNNGEISRSGNINDELLDRLNQLEFYNKPFPKSLGIEFVKEIVLPLMETYSSSIEDKLCTFTEHIAIKIADALPVKQGKLLITGGGAYNQYLVERIKNHLPKAEIIIPDKQILEFKEALIFALLGVLRLRNEINVLASVTGARADHCSGKIFRPAVKFK